MQIPRELVGTAAGPLCQEIDARWLMAYAAGIGEDHPARLDTLRPDGPLAHPLFPVCYEWPLAVALRGLLPPEIVVRGVHATHDLHLYRSPRAGDLLATRAVVARVEPRRAGTAVVSRFDTHDAQGQPVSTTWYGSVYRDVAGTPAGEPPPPYPAGPEGDAAAPLWQAQVPVAATLAHVYTECARIWNPIHTDRAVAQAAGLPDIILHGTATLALGVSQALRREPGGPLVRVRRITARFTGMVRLPDVLHVRGLGHAAVDGGRLVRFDVLGPDGRPVVTSGALVVVP